MCVCVSAGVCLKVPFNRVVVKKSIDTSGHVDIAGVCCNHACVAASHTCIYIHIYTCTY